MKMSSRVALLVLPLLIAASGCSSSEISEAELAVQGKELKVTEILSDTEHSCILAVVTPDGVYHSVKAVRNTLMVIDAYIEACGQAQVGDIVTVRDFEHAEQVTDTQYSYYFDTIFSREGGVVVQE